MRFLQKTAIVTGASRGIGAATARLLADNGYNVLVNYEKNAQAAQSVVDEIRARGGEAVAFCADVSRTTDAQALCDFAARQYGRADLLVNSAGVAHSALLTDMTDAQYDRLFDVNMRGVFNMCRACVPLMLRVHSGAIVNVGSMWGEIGAACESVYSASKAAVFGFTKALAKELGPSGIRVNAVSPGYIDTDMNAALDADARAALIGETPLARVGAPEDVAQAVLYLAGASFVTGRILGVSGGLVI
ncbi:MAG: glucose 1-dehydrogenase [Oscillospiraceae bacterium]|nr:glucose 1-dehydrogenase [Oscillospiraceae bacterium]